MSEPKIRYAKSTDIPEITKCFRKLYAGDEEQPFYNSKISLGRLRAGQVILLATAGKMIAGFLWLIWYEHIKHKGIAYIEELYIKLKFRRTGIGRKLVKAALEKARKEKLDVAFVSAGVHMPGALKFYEKVGFHPTRKGWFYKSLD